MNTHEIKRYPTRKMYDSLEGRYVTLDDIAGFVRRYEPIRIVESKSGDDITVPVLLQVIGEQNGKGESPLLTEQTLLNLIRLNGSPLVRTWAGLIEQAMAAFAGQMRNAGPNPAFDLSAFDPFGMWTRKPGSDDKS